MTTLVTGGAGFIGANVAHRMLQAGERVRLFDDLSREHVELNVAWLRQVHGDVDLVIGDVRDEARVRLAMRDVAHVFHLAAQVAVTRSLVEPVHDFDVNVRGTMTILEAARAMKSPPSLLFTSTNKVYGACDDVALTRRGSRYVPEDPHVRDAGIGEARPLEFRSPYGCAKGAADQYVLDWSRSYGLSTCAFRMSCIYGPRQFGNEDQGWVAHFLFRAVRGDSLVIYGDGCQVRDILGVDDLVDAMLLARGQMSRISGHAFNVGGGPDNALSLLELVDRIEGMLRRRPIVRFEPWRTADQRYYVSDLRKIERVLGWHPRVGIDEGLRRLHGWISSSGVGVDRGARVAPEAVS
jgi:CDP-paratose 2-epimerase